MKKIAVLISLLLVSGILIYATSNSKAKIHVGTFQYFPDTVDFCGELAPLNVQDVKERFDRELLVNANLDASTLLVIKRANKVFPVIEPILAKYNVPDDFKYLAVIESGLVNVVSPAGARGIWQFMPETAREKGMEVSESVDERYHLEKATEAACKYLTIAHDKFGSWTLAAASYNGGMSGISKQIEFQKVENYYDLLLNDETSRYVFRILALKEIMRSPQLYGFAVTKEELYKNSVTRKIEVDTTIVDLAFFAKSQGINYKILKYHNPWLRDKKLENPKRSKYIIEIPTQD